MSRLEDALGICAHQYEECPIYRQRLLADESRKRKAAAPARLAG